MQHTRSQRSHPINPMPPGKMTSHKHTKTSRRIQSRTTAPRDRERKTQRTPTRREPDQYRRQRGPENLLLSRIQTHPKRHDQQQQTAHELDHELRRDSRLVREQEAAADLEKPRARRGAEQETCKCPAQRLRRDIQYETWERGQPREEGSERNQGVEMCAGNRAEAVNQKRDEDRVDARGDQGAEERGGAEDARCRGWLGRWCARGEGVVRAAEHEDHGSYASLARRGCQARTPLCGSVPRARPDTKTRTLTLQDQRTETLDNSSLVHIHLPEPAEIEHLPEIQIRRRVGHFPQQFGIRRVRPVEDECLIAT